MIKNFLKKNFNSIKICAVFTTVCFLISTLGANLYAIPMAENTNQKYEDIFNKASSISNEYGKITSSKDAQSDITVINIQDLHCHPQTQRNIAKIIGQISDKYNLKRVYVEGGYGDIDVSWLSSIKDENIRKQVIEKLLEDGILTGSEYYKLTNNNEVELKGIDEELLHRENIRRLSWIIDNQNKYRDVIKKVEREINVLEKIYVNGRNERFNGDIEDYISGKTDTKRFYRKLIKYVKDINANPDKYNNITAIRLQDYPNISKFMTLRKTSKNINVMDVTRQLQVVITELKSRLPYNVYTKLLKETENFSDSQKVVELISLLCEKEGIDLDNNYKALSEFLKSNELNRELNTVELVYEERQLITEIRKALSYNNEEYEITFVSDFSRYFKDYLEYKLTDADWKYFESGYEQFRQLYAKYASIDRIKEIENDFSEFNKYYEINDIRNEIFVDNLLQDGQPCTVEQSKLRQDEEILKQSKEVIIAVTGGFHSNALEDILQAKKVNTIVITPSIFEGIEKATKQYKGIIKEQSKQFQYQALAYKILSCAETPAQKAVMYGALKSLVGNNSARIREILGDVDLTELDNLLQNLQENAQIQNKISDITKILEIEAESLLNVLPKEGGKKILSPNIDKLLLDISEQLINMGIFLSDGVIFDIENSTLNGKDLKGIPVEVYSRMPDGMQKYLYEASVFEGDKTAPIWEEIVYRFIPALLFGSLILAATIFIPPISVLGLSLTLTDAVKMVAIGLFSYFQKTFIKAHVLTKQLEKKGQSTDAGFYKIWTDNDLTPNQKIEKTIEVIKNRIFVIFPNRSQKEEFDIFYERDKAAAEIKEGLTISTIFFTIPYVIAMLLFNLMPAGVTATIVSTILSYVTATIVSIILHYINNIAAKVIKDKGLLQKKKKDIDFKDIQRRIKNIKRHIENPQEKKYFPEIKEGSFLFKFGLENKDKRIKEYLMDFDKIRMSFIYRLEKEVIDTKAEIENLRNKETISKEDRDRIRTLKEKLETIEPEYMQIRSELGHDDIQKADATIKKIDELLPVFEEIEIILNMIEKFKYENSDANDEIGILERDFLDFVEHTFTKELMSLYDTKVTGIHVDRTVGFSTFLGKAMPFNNNVRKIYRLMLSSMLHDIGKNLVPGTILNKQGSFDELERDIMELHVVFGGHILRSSILRRLSYTAENHHRYTFETKVEEFLKRAKEEGRTEFLYSRTFPSIHEEKVTLIENIIDFLEKLNPELFFDSDEDQYQYPKSLNDIERILENIKIKLTVSQQELIDSWLQEIEQIEDEILISKIVGLADVFEAVSPKLSFDSERTYQFSRRIKDISKILEDIDMNVKLTESQNKERIILLSEIAQIDSENDAIKKQAMERNFIKKVLYDHSRSAVIKYIRETNYEQVRKNAFKIIFTKYPKDIFKELGKSEDEFMNDFKDNPKETVDKCMSLVDSSVFEFDTEVIKAFLEFYFRGEDISVNNAIAARLNNKRKNRFIIYMENLAYSLHKIFVNVNRILVRFVPIIASVFSEEETAHSVSAPSLSAKGKMSARKKRKERRDKEQTTQYRLVSGQNTEEFLMGLVHNNAYSYTKLTDIVNEYDIDLSSEAELINVLAENIYYPKETLYEIIRFARKYSINTDFQFEILLTHISVFDNLDAIDNLFSLDDTNIHLLDDIYYGAKDVYKQNLEGLEILLLDIDNLNEKLNGFRSLYFDKFNLSLNDIDMDKFTLFIEQFDKIKNLSKQDFQKLLSLDYAAINFILTAVSTGEEITKIFKYADEFNLSPKTFDVKLNKKDFEDVRYKAVIQYIDLGDEKFFKKLFSLDKQTLRIVVDSVPDSEFIKEYLFNEDKYCGNKTYFEVYSEFLSKIKDLNYRNIAVENNYLALKLLVNEGFNDIVSTQKMKDLIGTDNIISKYFIAIFVSRFIYDSLQYEVFNYDISSQDFQDRLTLIMDIYAELLNEMKEISIFSKVTKVYVVCNNEILPNGIRRFDARVFNRILGYFQDVPNVTNFDRAENENANRDWLDSFRKFGLDSDNPMNEKGYFVFMGHGGTIHLQSVSPRYDKIFKGKIIKSDLNSKSEFITVEELSDALFELAVRDYKKVDLRNITIDLSSCHSYEFARTVYDLLDKKYSEYTQTHEDFNGTYPTIITATGLETELTYTVFTQTINNFHDAVINTLRNGKIEEYTLDMLATSEFQIHESNITMFASYRNSEFKKNIKDVRNSVRYLFEKDKETEVKVKEKALEDISPLTADVLEASILKPVKSKLKSLESKLADYAHIWEELVFRTAPTAVSVIISSIIISLPFSPFITIPLGIITLGIYYKQVFVPYQEKFINAHIITDWLASKDAGDYTLSDVLKMAILGKFPSEELKQEYEKYYELEQSQAHRDNLKKPTLILSVPYVIATIAPFVFALYPVAAVIISVTLATLTAQFLHYKYNKRQQDSEKLLNILEEEKIIRKNTRQYLRTQNIRETIKDRIQELCDDKKIDLSKDEFLQELLFTQWLCLADESILKILFEIKVDGKNSELKKKIVTEYLTAKDNYYTEREFSLFKELINSDNEDILKYLLNYPAKNFIDSFYIYVINGGREDCLDKIGDIISSTGGKLSPTNIFWTLRKYDTYKQNKDDLADENDKNYNLKCAILAKYVGDISLDDSDIDTDKIKRIFEINNTGLLNYILYGITYDSLDNFVERILSQYEEEDFNILNKVPQNELKDLLEKHPSNKIDMLTNILAMRNVLEFLDKDSLKDFLSLFYSNKELPFKKIISQVSETGKNKEQIFREQAKELDKYVKFINSKSSYIINKNIPIAEIIENTNSVEEIEKYFNLVDKYNLIFNIIRTNKTNKTNKKLYLDYRWKLALEYLNIEEDYQGEIFEYLLKTNADENSKFSQKYKNIYDLFHDFPKDSNFFKQYLFNNKNKQTYKKLFDTLIKLKFTGIASENDFLALKLLTDDNFNNTLNALLQESHLWDFHNMSEEDVIVVKYHSAIAVSRFIYDSVGSEIAGYNLSSDDIKKQIGVITELYVEALRQMGLIVLLDSHTKIYGLFNDEINAENERFNEEAIQKMLEILGVVDKMDFQPAFYKIKDSSDAHTAKVSWLGSIESLILERDEEKAYFMFRGHGNEENESNRLILNQNDEVITAQEMADALFNLATKEQDSVDLRRVTIDLSCCYSYFFAREVYNILEQKYKNYVKDNKDFKGTFPTIITEAGLETKYGHSIVSGQSENEEINQWIGNLHEGIIKVLQGQQGQQDQQEKRLTLGMLALSEYQFSLSNITMFASFDDNMTEKIEEIRETTQKVFEGYKTQTDRMAVPPLTGGRFEASILKPLGLKLADYAHIWEELFFRTAPTAVSVIISSIIISLPFSPFITIPLGIITLGIYYKQVFVPYQEKFINAHIITDWLASKDAGDYTLSDVLKMAILGKFPSEELKQEYEKYYELEQSQAHRDNLKKPTLILSVPYVIATIAPFVFALYPVAAVIISVTLATLTAQFLHYKYNKNQQDPGKLLKIEVEKNYFENAREYLKTKSIAETVKSKIQRVCAKNKIDLSNDKFFQELLFDYRLCFSEEPSLEYLLEIKIDGKNSELKKKVLNRYLDEIGYSIPQSGERKIYLLKELINSDDEIILNYLLNHSVKDFLEKDISKTKDFLSKTAKIISLTGGQISSEDLSSFIYNYEIYEQIENDENYDLKFAIFMKNIKDLTSQSDIDTIKWLFKINHKELLKYTLYGLDFDNISMLKDFFVYTDEDLYILDKFSQELETLLSLSQNENKNINLLIDLLENGKKIKDLNSNDFTELFLLYIAYEKFPFATIIEQINNSKELSKYISLLKKYDIFFDTKEQDEKGGVKNPVYRWQIALKFLHIEEDINSEIFEYLLTEDKNATLEQKKLYWKKYKLFESFPANSWIFKEYLFNEKYKKTYIKLFDSLASLGFRGIAAENDFLALRLLVDKNFNDILDKSQIHNSLSEEEKLVARYHSAIAVSRFIYDSVGNEIAGYDLSSDDIKKQIGVITELYVEALRQMGQIVLLDSHTKIYGLFNDETKDGEERFNKEAIQKMLEILGVVDKMDFQPTFYKVKDFSDARAAKGSWLDSIESLTLGREEERAYFVFRGHGDELNETNRLIVNAEKTEVITAQEMADALFNLATKEQDSVDLRRVTIDLSCCYSYFFARKVYDILEQKYKDYNEGYKDFKGTFPTIIVAAGLETETGLTTPSGQSENKEITQWIGNLHEGIIKVLKDKNISKSLTLDTLALSEYQFSSSNITMFASFDDNMTEKIEEIRETTQTVFEGYKVQTDKTEQFFPVQKGEEEQETAGMKSATGRMAVPPLTGGRFEASILKPLGLKLADYAHIWEELFFRTAPTAVSVIISSLIISLPFSPFITIPLGIITLGIYYKQVFVPYQEKFINAHIITDWLASKDAGDYTLSDVLKMAILGKFPSEELKQEYEKYYELEQSQAHRDNLKKPTLILSVPYVIATIAPFVFALYPVAAVIISVTLATLTAQFLHYKYNKRQQNQDESKSIIEEAGEELKEDSSEESSDSKTYMKRLIRIISGSIRTNIDKIFNSNFINYRQDKTRLIALSLSKMIVKHASIVKHIAIDYKFIKASGIQEAINLFGKDARLNEEGQIEIAIVDGIEELKDKFTLINTGLKVNGASIYRIKGSNLLMYGAKGQQSIKIVKTLNGSELLNKDIIEMLKANGENADEIQTQATVTRAGEGISITDDIVEIGEMELAGKSPEQVKQFVASAFEIKRVMGIMYGQKTIIDLKSVTDLGKLDATVDNGRARKVISKKQFEDLGLTETKIEQLQQKGIEIYIDNGEEQLSDAETENYKNKKVAGQIIRDEQGIRIKNYDTDEETKIEEILEDQNIESKILTAETPVMIGIDILTRHFRQGNVTAVQREFGALLGKIKMSLNLGELNSNDIEYMGYNISFEKVPTLTQDQIEKLFEKVGDELQITDKDKLIEIIGPETEFAIMLKTIKNKDTEKRLKEIAVERILAKAALIEKDKEFGLKDKNLEILLGKMLLAQVNNTDKKSTNISADFKGGMNKIMEKIKEETAKAMQKDEAAINTVIELILVYGDNYKEKQLSRQTDTNDVRNYRAMLVAA